MRRLAFREDADTKAYSGEAIEEKALAEDAERKAAVPATAEGDLARERARTQALEQQLAAREYEQKLAAQERARNQELEQQLSIRQNDQKLVAPEAPGGETARTYGTGLPAARPRQYHSGAERARARRGER